MNTLSRRKFLALAPVAAVIPFVKAEEKTVPLQSSSNLNVQRKYDLLLTGIVPQCGLIYASNILKYYYALYRNCSYLNYSNGQVQRCDDKQILSAYISFADFGAEPVSGNFFASMSAQNLTSHAELLHKKNTIVVVPEDILYSLWSYLIVLQTNVTSIDFSEKQMKLKKDSIVADKEKVKLFLSHYKNNMKLVHEKKLQTLNVKLRDISLEAQVSALFSKLNILTDRAAFVSRLKRLEIFRETFYAEDPIEYIKNRDQVLSWVGSSFESRG